MLPQVVFTWDIVEGNPVESLKGVQQSLGEGPYVVRSSCRGEDSKELSYAGVFDSVLHVESRLDPFLKAASLSIGHVR